MSDAITRAVEMAIAAQNSIHNHEGICAERLAMIIGRFDASRTDRAEFREEMQTAIAGVYAILWKAAFALVTAMGGLAATVILQRGHV